MNYNIILGQVQPSPDHLEMELVADKIKEYGKFYASETLSGNRLQFRFKTYHLALWTLQYLARWLNLKEPNSASVEIDMCRATLIFKNSIAKISL